MRVPFIFGAVALAGLGQATVLTFDISGISSGNVMPQGYGDNVTAATMGNFSYDIGNGITPDVTVLYEGFLGGGGTTELNWWENGYSDLTKVVEYEVDGAPGFRIALTASTGNVILDQFDVGNWGADMFIPSVKVRDQTGAILYQLDNWLLSGSGFPHQTFTFNNLQAQSLSIEFDLTGLGGNSDNLGLDNIRFRQTAVPEPATLGALALVAVAALRRRKA